jgi:hypothetical protein
MIKGYKNIIASGILASVFTISAYAGNPDRAGQASVSQLLINPWARSSALGGSNSASISGIESQYLNVAGLAHTKKTEFMFTQTNWLSGAGIGISALGFGQRVGSSNVIGVSLMSMNYGKINRTTASSPEGGLGTYSYKNFNMNLSYAKEFSNSIYGGINIKVISENLDNLSARGVALDAGIQYQASFYNKEKFKGNDIVKARKNVKFGIALKNVGTPMNFTGDGLSTTAIIQNDTKTILTVNQRSARTDLPSLINIGMSYDYYLSNENNDNIITISGNFLSNSFTKDNFQFGAQYSFKKMFIARAGYFLEAKGGTSSLVDTRTNAFTGLSVGFTIEAPSSKDEEKASRFGVDYSYRLTNPWGGSHSIGVRLAF